MSQREKNEEVTMKLAGPFRRNWPLLAAIALSFIVGPFISDLLRSYRGVILEVKGDRVFVGWAGNRPPSWQAYTGGKPSDILVKSIGSLEAGLEEASPEDEEVMRLYKRYTATYAGIVRAIEAPLNRGAAHTAIIDLEQGGEYRLPVWDEELAQMIAVGRRVEKLSGRWDPIVTPNIDHSTIRLPEGALPDQSSSESKP